MAGSQIFLSMLSPSHWRLSRRSASLPVQSPCVPASGVKLRANSVRRSIASIDGHRAIGDPPANFEELITPLTAVFITLERRSCGTQDHRTILNLAPDHGNVPAIVTDTFFLFVGGIVLLVDDDQPELANWREYRRASADHDVDLGRPRFAATGSSVARL